MKKNIVLVITTVLLLGITAYKASIAEESKKAEEAKSVAWYVANVPAARKQNKECYDNPELKETPNCQNSLRALQISFSGAN